MVLVLVIFIFVIVVIVIDVRIIIVIKVIAAISVVIDIIAELPEGCRTSWTMNIKVPIAMCQCWCKYSRSTYPYLSNQLPSTPRAERSPPT